MTGIVVKLPSMSPRKRFKEKYFLLKTLVQKLFSGILSHFFALLTGKVGRFFRTVCLPVRCTLCTLYFNNSWFFENYWKRAETLKVFGSKYAPVLSKNQITCSNEKRRVKSFLRKLTVLFWFWAHKFFSSLAKIDEERCQNCIRFVQKTELREKSFVKKILAIVFFSDFLLVFDGLFKKLEFFVGVVETGIIMSRITFWEISFEFFQVLSCFMTLSWKIMDFGIKVRPLLSLLQVTFPREKTSWEKFGSSLELLMWSAFSWFFGKENQ